MWSRNIWKLSQSSPLDVIHNHITRQLWDLRTTKFVTLFYYWEGCPDKIIQSDVELIKDSEHIIPESFENKILKALESDKEDADFEDTEKDEEEVSGIYAQYTNIELNDAATYYKQKESHLEKALLDDAES